MNIKIAQLQDNKRKNGTYTPATKLKYTIIRPNQIILTQQV